LTQQGLNPASLLQDGWLSQAKYGIVVLPYFFS
jgi:hypothetical protein